MSRKYLKKLFLKTALVSIFTAAVIVTRIDTAWGSAFAAASLIGLINWSGLAMLIFGFTDKQKNELFGGLALKLVALGLFFSLVLPTFLHNMTALLLGFSMFLVTVVLEALGVLYSAAIGKNDQGGLPPKLSFLKQRNAQDA